MCPAPVGNEFWKLRTRHIPRSTAYEDAEELMEAAQEYFEWIEQNPLFDKKCTVAGGVPVYYEIEKPRVMTYSGLCIALGITEMTWWNYRKTPHLQEAVQFIESVIRTQKFELAAAELANPGIISRDLGLTDNHKVEQKGTITNVNYSAEDFKRAQAELEGVLGDLD